MKKLLLILTLAAFAVAVQAGDEKATDKACCAAKPAKAEQAKADQAKGGCCPMMSKEAKSGGCAMACKETKTAKLESPKESAKK